jgi:hypothetical protein
MNKYISFFSFFSFEADYHPCLVWPLWPKLPTSDDFGWGHPKLYMGIAETEMKEIKNLKTVFGGSFVNL